MRKKLVISITLLLVSIMLLNCIAPVLKVAADTDMKIVFERNLFTALKKELERQQIEAVYNEAQRTIIINESQIARVTTLSLANSGLTTLTGLEVFKNLKSLDVSSNELTKDSNLEVLNSFTLHTLDLSSNAIEDVSMVDAIRTNSIQRLNLHNQKFDIVEVIEVDISSKSNQYNGITYPLPKILTDNVSYIQSEWLLEQNWGIGLTADGLQIPVESENACTAYNAPYIDWSSFDHQNLKVIYAYKTAVMYKPLKGMVKVSIKVSDSTNTLYNSDINMYFVVVDSTERGIYLKDKNLYNAVKSQLTKGQDDNADLISYYEAENSRNLYEIYYNDAQVIVVSIDDIVNKIPSLNLSGKRIRNVDGLEKFVGLETKLDLSGNYIKEFDSLLQLEENQEKEEVLLRERVKEQMALVKQTLSEIDKVQAEIDSINKKLADAEQSFKEKYDKLKKELDDLKAKRQLIEDQLTTIRGQLAPLQAQIDDLNDKMNDEIDKLKDLNAQLLTAKNELVDLENSNRDKLEAIERAEQAVRDKEKEIEEVKTKISDAEKAILEKESLKAQYNEQLTTLNQTIAIIDGDIAIVEAEMVGTGENYLDNEYVQILLADKARISAEFADKEAEINRIVDEINELKRKITEYNDQLDTKKDELQDCKDALDRAKEEYEATGIEDKKAEIARLENEIAAVERQIEIYKTQIENVEKSLNDKKAELEKKEKELEEIDKKIEAKIKEIDKAVEDYNNSIKGDLFTRLEELKQELERLKGILYTRMKRLYQIYNRIDRLTGYATSDIRLLTDETFYNMTFAQSKSLFDAQVAKIGKIEDYLTGFEYKYLIDKYHIPTTITTTSKKKVVNPDGSVTEVEYTETKAIEHPIHKYYSELATDDWTVGNYKAEINNIMIDDIYFAMYAHCYLARVLENTTKCVAHEYCDYYIQRLKISGQSTAKYEDAKESYLEVYARYAGSDKCEGRVGYPATFGTLYNYAKRITLASTAEFDAYVYLPRLLILDVSENLLESIKNLDQFSKLIEFYAGDNELVKVDDVNWTSVNEHLKVLDLSLNDISEIDVLDVLTNIEYLDLSKNLIEGEFTFKVENLKKLKTLDLSYNRITDIQRLINFLAYEARAYGYNGDIATFLRKSGKFNCYFGYQQLEMIVPKVLKPGVVEKIELPKIFRQIEEIDYENTSFAIDSINGNVTSDGKEVILDVSKEGKCEAVVSIKNTKTTKSFGYGTECKISYKVGTANELLVTISPEEVTVVKGQTQQFTAKVTGGNVDYNKVTWSVKGNNSPATEIDETGLLTVGEDESSETIEVVAVSFYDGESTGKALVIVADVDPNAPEEPEKPEQPEQPQQPEQPKQPEQPQQPAEQNKEEKKNNGLAESLNPSGDLRNLGTDPVSPTDDTKEEKEPTAQKPVEQTKNIKLGYKVDSENGYLLEVKAKTSVADFKKIILNDGNYNVVVKSVDEKKVTTGYVKTGMFVQIQDKNGNTVKDSNGNLMNYEIVIKGDVNGDGYADSLDSILIKSYRSSVTKLTGAYLKAADINSDNAIDANDSKLLLYHRAEVSGYNLNYTK